MNIENKIFGAIHHARIAIAVFSANFAHSKWCMNELVEILNCRRDHHLVFIPIFYIRLAEVKTLRESKFEQALEKFDVKERDNKQRDWKAAIAEATEIHGFELENDAHGNEAALIDLLVDRIEVRPLDSVENAIPRPHHVKVCRPSGGKGEKSWDFAGIKGIDVHHADYTESITFEDD
ncbi:probable disease resistance protein At4g19530 [Eucalyptus grandis]|uniref:probable disease resistance protein At4g19530 n=1 Tax=Eucalyptus grandis TaxID=71139 RepID=UPI00192E8AEB|nr:probable disease resistance protein At4g19530 [Eucalyptus grandis]